MKNNEKIEVVDMTKFAGLWMVSVAAEGRNAYYFADENNIGSINENYDVSWERRNEYVYILTPMIKGETPSKVSKKLSKSLKEVSLETGKVYHFVEVKEINSKLLLKSSIMEYKISIEKILNIPGGKKVSVNMAFQSPFLHFFLPRNARGEFVNLKEQRICLKTMELPSSLPKLLLEIMPYFEDDHNLTYKKRSGSTLFFGKGSSGPAAMPFFAEDIADAIKRLRSALRAYNLKTGTDELIIKEGECTISYRNDYETPEGKKKKGGLQPGDFTISASDIKVAFRYGSNCTLKVSS